MKTKLFLTGLALFAITTVGFSQNGNQQNKPAGNKGNQSGWIDQNGNGVCDNFENRTPRQGQGLGNRYRNGQGQGQGLHRNGMRNGQGKGRFYIDENGNSVCDRFEENQKDQPEKK
ncbi:MAG TPA: hypothetical protein VHO50_14130 [Bacteroidales bacterium]|nr:hypothetical protein [Bacteroidales bacterium]